jgi:hypothetical protein
MPVEELLQREERAQIQLSKMIARSIVRQKKRAGLDAKVDEAVAIIQSGEGC